MIFVRLQVNALKYELVFYSVFLHGINLILSILIISKFNSPKAGSDETIRWDLDGTYVNDALIKVMDHRTINYRSTL